MGTAGKNEAVTLTCHLVLIISKAIIPPILNSKEICIPRSGMLRLREVK